jgi:hypothetical protein
MSALADFLGVPGWLRIVVMLAMLAMALIVGLAALGALIMLGERAWRGSLALTESLGMFFYNVAMAAFGRLGALLKALARLLWWPVTLAWTYTGLRALDALALKTDAIRQRQQLWQLWRREFRDQFPTFGEFVEAFERGGKPRVEPDFNSGPRREERPKREEPPRPPPPPDPQLVAYAAACRLLGLPESGFTLHELNARYRALIGAAHPDRNGGSNARAAALNAARDLIKRRKGWQ